MHDRNWERVAGYAGLAAVLLFVVPTFVGAGTMPKASDHDSVFKAYLINHHAYIMRGMWLTALAAVLVLWLGSGVRSALQRHDSEGGHLATMVFALFVAAAVILGISSALEGGLAYKAVAGSSPAVVRTLFDISAFMGTTVLGLVTTVAASVIAVAVLATRTLPRPVGVISAVAAAVNLAGSMTVFPSRGFFSLEGAFGFVGLVVTMVWLISLSVALIRPAMAGAEAVSPVAPLAGG
jgi:hypothetical protein